MPERRPAQPGPLPKSTSPGRGYRARHRNRRGPRHAASARPEVTDPNHDAATASSSASPSQAAAAANIGPDPAPRYIRNELTSGADTTKSIRHTRSSAGRRRYVQANQSSTTRLARERVKNARTFTYWPEWGWSSIRGSFMGQSQVCGSSYRGDPTEHMFSAPERRAVYRVIAERRDMRRFVPGGVVSEDVLARLLHAAHAAPSVGLMQPWRFIRITDETLKRRIHALVDDERLLTAEALGAREEEFLALKVEGILDCAELLVVALCDRRGSYIFGRRTLPQMDLASVSCAIQNLWLAARSEGLGMGWVSLFDPQRLAALLAMPADAEPVAILCLGPVPEFPDRPALELDGWAYARPLAEFVSENRWSYPSALATDHHHGE